MSRDAGVKPLGKNRWSVRVKRIDKRTGKKCNRKDTVRGTKADALRRRDELRAELAGDRRRERMRLGEFARAWLARRVLKDSTRDKYAGALEHIIPQLGELYVDAIAPSDVAGYVARRAAAAAGNTVLNELRLLRTIAKDTVAEGLATRYWCERVKPPIVARYTDDRPNLLRDAGDASRVLEHVRPRWRGLVALLLTTSLRIGEATALDWESIRIARMRLDDVDVDVGIARICRGNYRGRATTTKNRSSEREVVLLPEVLELLGPRRDRGLVFPTRAGTMHRGAPLRRVLARACAAAGVSRITAHGLRRTFNNTGRQVGEREVLKSLTGHATDEMVSHYSLVGAAEKAALARGVAAKLGVLEVSAPRTGQGANP